MKVIIVTRNFPPAICGVGDYSYQLQKQFGRDEIKAGIITKQARGWGLITGNQVSHGGSLQQTLRSTKKNFPDAILWWQYVPGSFHPKALPFYLVSILLRERLLGRKQLIFFHEVSVRLRGNGIKGLFQGLGQRCIANLLNLTANHSATSIRLYQSYFPIKKPIAVPVGANILPKESAVEKRKNPHEMHLFCFTNRCTPALLEAVGGFANCRLVLAGHCTLQQQANITKEVQNLKRPEMVEIKGELTESELAQTLWEADIFLHHQPLNALGEGGVSAKNGTIAAAFAFGLPIITTEGDMTDRGLFRNEENVVLLAAPSAENWAVAIRSLLENAHRRELLGREARKTYLSHFHWDIISADLLSILQSK